MITLFIKIFSIYDIDEIVILYNYNYTIKHILFFKKDFVKVINKEK